MHLKPIYIILLITSTLFTQEEPVEDNYLGLETKQEMLTWNDKYPNSIAFGFGTSNPINGNLIAYNERGQSINKWIFAKFNNYYNLNLYNKEINFSLLAGTENFYFLNIVNIWNIFSYRMFDIFNIGVGPGANIILHKFKHEETAFGLIFDLNTNIPLNIYNINSTIGLNMKHILTAYDKIEELGPYNSQIYNFYLDIYFPTKHLFNILK